MASGTRQRVPHWPSAMTFSVPVVGTSHYRDALLAGLGPIEHEHQVTYRLARLVPEPENQHDELAICVYFDGARVGYLSREDARRYRTAMVPVCESSARAMAIGKPKSAKHFMSLALDIDWNTPPAGNDLYADATIVSMPIVQPLLIESEGYAFLVAMHLDRMAVRNCLPGTGLSVWLQPPDHQNIFLFAPGSLGGSGRIAVIHRDVLTHFNLTVDNFEPIVYQTGHRSMVIYFRLGQTTA